MRRASSKNFDCSGLGIGLRVIDRSARVQGTGGCNYHHSENDGGQAIVGNVSHGGEGTAKNEANLMNLVPALLSHAQTVATDYAERRRFAAGRCVGFTEREEGRQRARLMGPGSMVASPTKPSSSDVGPWRWCAKHAEVLRANENYSARSSSGV